MLDVRSDTASLPSLEMLDAMRTARVGDEILGDDPTVNELEAYGASLFQKEAALFTVSGTMSNQIAVMAFCDRGDEIILGRESHMYNLEAGGLAALSQVQVRTIPCSKGWYDPRLVEAAIRCPGKQCPKTSLVCIENTYDLNRGYPVTVDNTLEIAALARAHNIPLYIDGARLFNAAAALGVEITELSDPADAIQICMTKGLSAPFGSLLLGDAAFVEKARWLKQRIGGGMRQAGYLAAPALIALKTMPEKIAEDNLRTRRLAEEITRFASDLFDLTDVKSNIITLDIGKRGIDPSAFLSTMLQNGVYPKHIGGTEFRIVCHHGITDMHIAQIARAIKDAVNLHTKPRDSNESCVLS